MHPPEAEHQLRDIQEKIRHHEATAKELMRQRATLITDAKQAGMTNRDVAKALGAYETHIYRMQRIK